MFEDSTPIINLTYGDALASIIFAMILAGVMFFTFKKAHRKLDYDASFNVMLVMLALITTIIMIIVSGNVALSLGMVGSLSLVRFRTNIRDNRDIGFVFWSMLIGLAAANRAYFIGTLASLLLSLLLLYSSRQISMDGAMLLVIRGRDVDVEYMETILDEFTSTYNLKAHNLLHDSFELVYEIRSSSQEQTQLAQTIKDFEGVDTVNILAPSADMIA